MPIITISRGSGSGGRLLAERLAADLGYETVSREDIVADAARFGVDEEDLRLALLKPPSVWSRFSYQKTRYLALVQSALCERVKQGKTVYHGNAGHLLLPGVSHVICIRLIAPLELRTRMLMERLEMGEDEALAYIHKVDRQREQWTRFLYGVDWLDPNLYDLCVNLRTLDIDDAVGLVQCASAAPHFQPTKESLKAMADLVLASRVRAALAAGDQTAGAEVEVRADDGVITLRGRLRPPSLVDQVLDVVAGVEGVKEVDRANLAAPDYTV